MSEQKTENDRIAAFAKELIKDVTKNGQNAEAAFYQLVGYVGYFKREEE